MLGYTRFQAVTAVNMAVAFHVTTVHAIATICAFVANLTGKYCCLFLSMLAGLAVKCFLSHSCLPVCFNCCKCISSSSCINLSYHHGIYIANKHELSSLTRTQFKIQGRRPGRGNQLESSCRPFCSKKPREGSRMLTGENPDCFIRTQIAADSIYSRRMFQQNSPTLRSMIYKTYLPKHARVQERAAKMAVRDPLGFLEMPRLIPPSSR